MVTKIQTNSGIYYLQVVKSVVTGAFYVFLLKDTGTAVYVARITKGDIKKLSFTLPQSNKTFRRISNRHIPQHMTRSLNAEDSLLVKTLLEPRITKLLIDFLLKQGYEDI